MLVVQEESTCASNSEADARHEKDPRQRRHREMLPHGTNHESGLQLRQTDENVEHPHLHSRVRRLTLLCCTLVHPM